MYSNGIIVLLVLLLVNCKIIDCSGEVSLEQPQSSHCSFKNTSCSHQISKSTGVHRDDDYCWMTHYKLNSPECYSAPMNGDNDLPFPGNLTIRPYIYVMLNEPTYRQTALNVTFSSITWQTLRMRFQQNGQEKNKNMCRDFTLKSDPSTLVKPTLFYDCLWSLSDYEKVTYHLEVTALKDGKNVNKKLTFIVPHNTKIDPNRTTLKEWEVFMYIDVSQPDNLILHFQPLPKKFGVKHYLVTMSGAKSLEVESSEDDVVIEYDTPPRKDPYKFAIVPVHEDCGVEGCTVSESSHIVIGEACFYSHKVMFIIAGICLCSIAISLKFTCKLWSAKKSDMDKPKVLFIYKSTHKSHVNVIDKLAEYLEGANISVFLDRRGIQKSVDKDPYNWYLSAFDKADIVLVFSSLQCCSSDTVGILRRVDDIALVQLKGAMKNKKLRFARVLLPYCKKTDIPVEATNFPLFQLPQGMNNLVTYIKDDKCMNKIINMSCLAKKSDLKSSGFSAAIKDATDTLAKHSVIENDHCKNASFVGSIQPKQDMYYIDETSLNQSVTENNVSDRVGQINMYHSLEGLNLMGDDFCMPLIPHKNSHNDSFNNLNL